MAQSFTDYELILVDDGSPDSSGEICDEYAEKDSRIRVIHKPNSGVSSARNAGLDVANGEYIYFLDGDDYIESNLFEKVINKADSGQYDMVSFSYKKVGAYEKILKFEKGEYFFDSEEKRADFIMENFLRYKSGFEVCFRIYKAEIIVKNKLRFNCQFDYAEDLLFNLYYLVHAKK